MRKTLILDSSQISSFLECPEAWRLSNVELIDIKSADSKKDEPLVAGTLFHKWLDIYYTQLALGNDGAAAVHETMSFNPDEADKVDPEFPLSKEMRLRLKNRFIDYVMRYSKTDYQTLSKTVYDIGIGENDLPYDSRRQVPLVEQGFSYKLLDTSEFLFVLEGRIDWIAASGTTSFWVDHKLQFRERELYGKSIQFRNYSLATELNLGIVNYIRMSQTLGPKTFVRQPISFSTIERLQWKDELIGIYKSILDRISNYNQWTAASWRNRKSCEGKFGYPCKFTPICEEFLTSTQEAVKSRDFGPKKEWRPW